MGCVATIREGVKVISVDNKNEEQYTTTAFLICRGNQVVQFKGEGK